MAETGRIVPLFADVTNHGADDIEQIKLVMKQDEQVITEQVIDVTIASGKTETVETTIETPDAGIYQFIVDVIDGEDVEPENNSLEIEFGYTDLRLVASDFFGENERTLLLKAENDSGFETGATINIYQDGPDGILLKTFSLESIEKGDTATVDYTISENSPSLYIEVVSDRSDYLTANNSIYYSMEKTPEEENDECVSLVSLDEDMTTLLFHGNEAAEVTVAIYDADGKMLSSGLRSVVENAGEVRVDMTSFTEADAVVVKVFFFNSLQEMMPLRKEVTVFLSVQ